MKNGTLEFVKHKFDMLLLVLLVAILLVGVSLAEHWHDTTLVIWATNTIAGLVGAFINMLTNRVNTNERSTDITPPTPVEVKPQ